ncbi:exosporium protein D [Bacillus sp. ISL-8]|uniref:Exosporium protein D n=1 Tax=Bacillus mycoides TaxID=1405 RepID=A0A1W6A8F5_BACMY|nr:exosporium protein D [Bacillus mycoides]ARJ22118.1 exosporium protein D [Bacillus mycoides]MBT2578123.1 exosporium protein D [Bacillus sp. ISL-8]TKI81309.1 exosporium protein D [Bacillus mycoides]
MADYFYKHGKKYYKNYSYSHNKKENCFIETHTIAGSNIPIDIVVPANTSRIVFEDSTNNHNKTLLQFHVPGTSAPIVITIRTRNARRPITATIATGETRIFQVENFEGLTVTNNTNTSSDIGIFIQKTFCICCDDQNDYYAEQSHSLNQKSNCFIETHTIAGSGTSSTGNVPLDIIVPPNSSRVVFEDLTINHNKTLLQISVPNDSGPIEVTIRTRISNTPIIATIVPNETRIFQVEDFQELTLTNNSDSFDFIDIFINKTFCICCNDQNSPCDECCNEYDNDYDC